MAIFLSVSGAIVATLGTVWVCGRVFWKEVAVPMSNRFYSGSIRTYTWLRLIVPNGFANLIINGWVAAAIFPHARPETASRAFILIDISITTALIFLFVSGGVCNHVISDRRWGVIAPPAYEKAPSAALRLALPFLFAVVIGALAWTALAATSITRIELVPFIVWKALTACGIAGVAARIGAQWGLATKL